MDIVSKITGDSLTAAEFNQIPEELEGLITDVGLTPASGDLAQIRKATAIMSAAGDFYTDSGSANAYVLATIGSQPRPTAYSDGMRIRFVPGNANTGASTVNVAAIGNKNIKVGSGAGTDPAAGDLAAGQVIELFYDLANDVFKIAVVVSGGTVQKVNARAVFDGKTSITIAESENVSSIIRNAAGDYTVNFTNNFATANYSAAIVCADSFVINIFGAATTGTAPTTSSFRFSTYESTSTITIDADWISITFFGDLA